MACGRPYGLINEEQEIAAANRATNRMFTARETKGHEPQTTVTGEWQVGAPENVRGFSDVGFFTRAPEGNQGAHRLPHGGLWRELRARVDSPRRDARLTGAGNVRGA